MCPACMTTLALIAAGAGSAGGLAAVVAKRFRSKPVAKELDRKERADAPARKEDRR